MVFALPQGVGDVDSIEIRTTTITESALPTVGIVNDAAHVTNNGSAVKVTDVIRVFQSKDPSWYVDTFKKMRGLFGKGLTAYARGGVLGLASEVAGMIIAPRTNIRG